MASKGREEFVTESGEKLVGVHPAGTCVGQWCTIHNPSDYAKAIGRQHWRMDKAMMERVCQHGVGHPDPDDPFADGVHGCDGCCMRPLRERLIHEGWSEITAEMAEKASLTQTTDTTNDRPYRKFLKVKESPMFFVNDPYLGDLAFTLIEEMETNEHGN